MKKKIKELDKQLSNIVTRASKEKDINDLKTILLNHLRNLGEDPILINTELPHLETPEIKFNEEDLKLEPMDVNLEPLDIDLKSIDPCPPCPRGKRGKK
jgi:hypothetical protein